MKLYQVCHNVWVKKPNNLFFSLQQLVVDLALINRNHHLVGNERSENDIEHSFAVALLCWFIHDNYNIDLDLNKIFKYAIVHDFAEKYAGDINTFASKEDRQKKVELEKNAVKLLNKEFKDFRGLVKALNNYELKADEEAIFVWTVDKIQALILGDMDGWRPYKKINISYEMFTKKHHEQLAICSSYCREIFETVLAYCETTFYDRPKTSS